MKAFDCVSFIIFKSNMKQILMSLTCYLLLYDFMTELYVRGSMNACMIVSKGDHMRHFLGIRIPLPGVAYNHSMVICLK